MDVVGVAGLRNEETGPACLAGSRGFALESHLFGAQAESERTEPCSNIIKLNKQTLTPTHSPSRFGSARLDITEHGWSR